MPTPGKDTTEWKLKRWGTAISIGLAGLGAALMELLPPDSKWLGLVVFLTSIAKETAENFKYDNGRNKLKDTEVKAQVAITELTNRALFQQPQAGVSANVDAIFEKKT